MSKSNKRNSIPNMIKFNLIQRLMTRVTKDIMDETLLGPPYIMDHYSEFNIILKNNSDYNLEFFMDILPTLNRISICISENSSYLEIILFDFLELI